MNWQRWWWQSNNLRWREFLRLSQTAMIGTGWKIWLLIKYWKVFFYWFTYNHWANMSIVKIYREGENRELSIRKDLHRFETSSCIQKCPARNSLVISISNEGMHPSLIHPHHQSPLKNIFLSQYFALQGWKSSLGEWGLPLYGGGKKARHHECPQWRVLNWFDIYDIYMVICVSSENKGYSSVSRHCPGLFWHSVRQQSKQRPRWYVLLTNIGITNGGKLSLYSSKWGSWNGGCQYSLYWA